MLMDSSPVSVRTQIALLLREVEVGQNSGTGSLTWAVIEPIIGICLLSVIFMIAFPAPPLGDSFALFYATGLLPLILFQDVTQKLVVALRFSRPLMGFTRIGIGDMILARAVFSLLTQLVAMSLILSSLGWLEGSLRALNLLQVFQSITALICLSLGAGVFGCWVGSIWPLWPRVWAVFLRPLVFVSGVFFLVDEIGDPFRDWLLWNPLAHVIFSLRSGIYTGYSGDLASLPYVLLAAGLLGFAGLLGLRANLATLVDELA